MLLEKYAPMTPTQFDAVARLLRSHGASREAARLVLLEGLSRKEAATHTGLAGPSVSGAVKRFKEAAHLIVEAFVVTSPGSENASPEKVRQTRIAAVIVNDRGEILPSTTRATLQGCEEHAQASYGDPAWQRLKEMGCRVCPCEIVLLG